MISNLDTYITYTKIRSSGPGGQNVQHRATKIRAVLSIKEVLPILALAPEQEKKLFILYPSGKIVVVSQNQRSQFQNKKIASREISRLLSSAIRLPKKRMLRLHESTRAKEKRITQKKLRSYIKQSRRIASGEY